MSKWEDEGYELMTTEQMLEAMRQGKRLSLVPVTVDDEEILSHYSDAERAICSASDDMNEITSIEYVGEEEVQCILVDDPEHLYLTDGFIPTHNTSNIIFLKSTDDSMLDTLTKMSGKTHRVVKDSKTITRDLEQVVTPNEAKISYGMKVVEEPVISYNDLAFIPDRNSMVFRAGDSPIWNKNQTILPMSWRLFQNNIVHPGHKYSLQTIPTMSTAKDFDVRKNIPDFEAMLEKRMYQAMIAEDATKLYQQVTEKTDLEMEQMDPDLRAEEIMSIINSTIYQQKKEAEAAEEAKRKRLEEAKKNALSRLGSEDFFRGAMFKHHDDEANVEVQQEVAKAKSEQAASDTCKFAGNQLAPSDFWSRMGVNRTYENEIAMAFHETRREFMQDRAHFSFDISRGPDDASLMSADKRIVYIRPNAQSKDFAKEMEDAVTDPNTRIFAEQGPRAIIENYENPVYVEDAFFKFLATQPDWKHFANGAFERKMAALMKAKLRPV